MKKLVYLSFALIFVACSEESEPVVTIISENETFSFNVEIADEPTEREKGLMFRDNLDGNSGMFFIFDEPQILNFWMRNTLMPLDIIFIDENFKIISVAENAEPCIEKDSTCPGYFSQSAAKYVLEIAGGRAEELGIKAGDKVQLRDFK